MTDWRRWKGLRGHVTYWKGWTAYQVFMRLPDGSTASKLGLWLLPSVGDYVYWDEAIAAMNAVPPVEVE